MKISAERIIEVGYKRDPKNIFDDVEQVTAQMVREGWALSDSCMEDGLGYIHLFFEKETSVD